MSGVFLETTPFVRKVRGVARGGQGGPVTPGAVMRGRQKRIIQCIRVGLIFLRRLPKKAEKTTELYFPFPCTLAPNTVTMPVRRVIGSTPALAATYTDLGQVLHSQLPVALRREIPAQYQRSVGSASE